MRQHNAAQVPRTPSAARFRRRWAAALAVTMMVPALAAPASAAAAATPGKPSSGMDGPGSAPPATPTPPAGLRGLANDFGGTPAERAAMQAAGVRARATHKPVVVNALTTETQQVVAQPTGGFAFAGNPEPVRARRGTGWTAVDTRLRRNGDGTLTPVATAYGSVRFSGGGTGPLATTTSGGTTYSVSWPGRLPAPQVDGATATYRGVLPDVDLVVSATDTGGFREVLVVKSASAAANPALADLVLPTRVQGGRRGTAAAAGGLTITDPTTGMTLDSSTALVWDSNRAAAPGQAMKMAAGRGGPDASDTGHAGEAARTGLVSVTGTDSQLRLRPDPAVLRGAGTVFPVYVDPTFNWHPVNAAAPAFDEVKQGSPCNGASYYNNTGSAGDYGRLGVGYNAWSGCIGIEHAYYQWKIPSVIWGSKVNSATVDATEVYSSYCDTTATVNLHWTGAISSGTDWNNRPGYVSGFNAAVAYGPSYNATYCPNNGNVTHGFNVLTPITKAASGHWSSFTAALAEDSYEANHNSKGFKRFADNPTLQIFYNRTPGLPAPSAMSAASGSNNAGCATTSPYPYMGKTISTNTPVLSAKISDPDGDALRATFKYWIDGSTTTATGLSGDNLASGSTAKFSLPASFVSTWTNGQVIDWQVQVTDGNATTLWSSTCHFVAYPTAPLQPTFTPLDTNYPDTDNGGGNGAPAGTPGSFTITSSGATATKFVYNLDVPPPTVNPPANETVTATNNSASITVTPFAPGPHTLWAAAIDAAGDASAMAAYRFVAVGHAPTTCASLVACFNNTAISPDTNMGVGAADGTASFSATDLTNAGWTSGGRITVNGASLSLPAYGAGQADNVLAANQTVNYTYQVPADGATALQFLAFSTNSFNARTTAVSNDSAPYVPNGTPVAGVYCFDSTDPSAYCPATGTITYTDGTTSSYTLTVPDWISGPATLAAVTLPHWNKASGQVTSTSRQPKIFPVSVPLMAGKTLASVTLPDVSNKSDLPNQGLHILSMAPRATTVGTVRPDGATTAAPTGESWTGAWASPTELNSNFLGSGINYSNLTIRTAVKPSISGDTVRIRLDNALGTNKLVIGHATVALDGGTPPSVLPTGTIQNLTFGGGAGTTIPTGGMVYSDPLPFTVTANRWLLVSFTLTNSVPMIPEHSWASETDLTYLSVPGSGDHTTDTTSTAFTATGSYSGQFTDILTNLDVTTAHVPTEAILGDGLIDAWQPNTKPNGTGGLRMSDDLAAVEPSTPAPYGTIAAGIESNYLMKDNPQTYNSKSVGGPSALSRIDRDILDQPGITTVVVDEGLEDILNGANADDLEADGYTELLTYLQANNINVIAMGLHPCDGYAGDGATGNSTNDPCTSTVDDYRVTINGWLAGGYPLGMGPWSTPSLFYVDPDAAIGVPDVANSEVKLDPNAGISADHVNLTDAGYAALTSAYLGAQDAWPMDNDSDPTSAADTANNANNPYLANNPAVGQDPATIEGTAAYSSDATRGTVLNLDGTSGSAATSGPVLNTGASFSVSTWVKLSQLPTRNAAVLSQTGGTDSAFTLQYDYTHSNAPGWSLTFSTTDVASPTRVTAYASGATTNWTHLVGVYNAATHTAQLYVNGALAGSATGVSPWSASGAFTFGRDQHNTTATNYLPGLISSVQAWDYAVSLPQVTALYQQIPAKPKVVLTLSLLASGNSRYVCADHTGTTALVANRTTVGPWETYDEVDVGGGYYAFLSHANGLYVTADNAGASALIANRSSVGTWEKFKVINNDDGTVSLLANANGKYVTSDSTGTNPLIASKTTIGTTEKFTISSL